jgi:hypothetical protein
MIHELHELLARAGARMRSVRLWSSLAVCWLFWAVVVWGVAQMATPDGWHWPTVWSLLGASALMTAILCWVAVRRIGRDPRNTAQRIEATHPELGAMLLAALETAPAPKFKRLGYLQAAVVRGAVSHGRQHDWANATSRSRLQLARTAHLASLAALASACLLLADRTTAHGNVGGATSGRDELVPGAQFEVEIQPGNGEIERGTTLLVLAKFKGALPPDAELVVRESPAKVAPIANGTEASADGAVTASNKPPAEGRSIRAMARSLDDPQFVGRVPGVAGPLRYHVEFAGQRSRTYRITVFDYPELNRADAKLDYTRLDDKVIEDVRRVTAVEGTQLTLQFRLNKDVKDARLVDRDGEEIVLKRAEGVDPVYETSYALARSQRFKLHLRDDQDRRNKLPPDIVVNVTTNKPAEIKITKPARDMRVSPVEELRLAGAVSDDFGVTGYGVSFALGGDEATELSLSEVAPQAAPSTAADAKPPKKADLEHLIDFEALEAEPDQLVSYYVWVDDIGPDGQPRRTLSDMYFAEVRHFDEIFRQGEQPTEQQQREQQQQQEQQGQQGGAGQQAEELAEIQKQVINATWKLLRRETGAQPTAEFATDATAVKDGQQQAIDKLAELTEQVSDSQSTEFASDANRHMESALAGLTSAIDASDPKALRAALSAEQAAYQALLKLRAREFNVTRSNQQQQQGQQGAAGGSASQQQLQQLELSAEENRYETQSRAAAASQENAEQLEESRQILNRLSELARRQEDLNERLREMQSALQEAETAEEREELERQLKRLRDQQREVLRDAEQLESEMQGSENAQQMQEAAEQLSETRSRVQEASEALDEGEVSQALTEGARAERELSELRDDFRRRTADRFTEEMRNLRDAAQQLDERQEQLSQQLDDMNAPGRRTLRDTGPREEFLNGLGEQQRELEQTLDTMRETVTEAEEPEPLLARQLYEAVQNTSDQRTGEALDTARQLTEAGVSSEASEAMRQADRGIDQLRQQIDRAAESVLGDETEALRRASDRLQALSEALNREIDQARGERGEGEPGREPGEQQRQGEPSQNGEPGEQGSQPGQGRQAGEVSQPGERGEGGREPSGQESPGAGQEGDAQPGEGRTPGEQPGQGQGQGEGRQPGDESQNQNPPGQGGQGQGQGQQPGEQGERQEQEGQSPSGQGPGQGQQPGAGQQPGEGQQGQGAGQAGQGQGGQPGDQEGNRPGNGGGAESPSDASREENGQGDRTAEGERRPGGQPGDGNPGGRNGGARDNGGGGGGGGIGAFQEAFNGAAADERGPITGEDFRNWSEGMREVEDMLDDPELASEAARIRDRAEQTRVDFVRRAKTPDWDKVVEMVADPLVELQTRIQEEIRRKESPDALAPIERDAAPAEFAEEVRLYYQRLGSGE